MCYVFFQLYSFVHNCGLARFFQAHKVDIRNINSIISANELKTRILFVKTKTKVTQYVNNLFFMHIISVCFGHWFNGIHNEKVSIFQVYEDKQE